MNFRSRIGSKLGAGFNRLFFLSAIVLAVAIALGAALTIARFQHQADAGMQNQLVLADIAQRAKQLRLLEVDRRPNHSTEAAEAQELAALTSAADKLVELDPDGDAAANVFEAARSYAETAQEHMRLLRTSPSAALMWNDERAEPSYKLLTEAIYETSTFYSAQAHLAQERERVGSAVAIAVQALLVGLLVFMAVRRLRAHELRAAEERARKEAQFRSMIQNSSDVVVILEASGQIRYLSPSVHRILGYDPAARQGLPFFTSIHPEDVPRAQEAFMQILSDPQYTGILELRIRHQDGCWRWLEITGTNLLADPNVGGIILNYRDVSERKELEDQLRHQALHDPLTGLANRALFNSMLGHALAAAKRRESSVAALYIDLDNFKQINDGLGHEAGDQLLHEVAQRLRSSLRAEDTPARLGGDEFAVIAEGVQADAAGEIAQRLLADLQRPYQLVGQQISVGASIGIAIAGADPISPEDLLRNADVAMYVAKGAGKGQYEIFEPTMYRRVKERLEMEMELRHALEHEELELHYQPILALNGGRLIGVEALVRWHNRTDRRLMMPGEFLPLAEQSGLILPLGRWVLEHACRQMQQWQTRFPAMESMLLSVNLSLRQFLDPGLLEAVEHALAVSGLSGERLVLEVAEEVLLQHLDFSRDKLRALKRLGIRVAIDDFGGGYSALRELRRLPIDVVKIHKSFVDNLMMSPGDSELTHSLIDLARRLKLRTLAEGIELDRQAVALGRMGCELGQGYHFARPLDPHDFEDLFGVFGTGDWRQAAITRAPAFDDLREATS